MVTMMVIVTIQLDRAVVHLVSLQLELCLVNMIKMSSDDET